MNLSKRTLRKRLGYLMVSAMLFTQSALLWAQVMMPLQTPHHLHHQKDCHGQQTVAADSVHQHCKDDCCDHDHTCSSQCLSMCVTAGVNLLPTTMTNLLPFYQNSATNLAKLLSPDGMYATVLDRPPRDFS